MPLTRPRRLRRPRARRLPTPRTRRSASDRLVTSGNVMPPYWSMRPGVNVDFVEVTMGLQMRRLRDEEQDASHGGGEGGGGDGDGDHEFCFHVRIPPRKLQSSMEEDGYGDDLERSILDEATSGIGRINIQPMQEIQVRRFVDTGEDGIFSMVARSFVPAPESRR